MVQEPARPPVEDPEERRGGDERHERAAAVPVGPREGLRVGPGDPDPGLGDARRLILPVLPDEVPDGRRDGEQHGGSPSGPLAAAQLGEAEEADQERESAEGQRAPGHQTEHEQADEEPVDAPDPPNATRRPERRRGPARSRA